MGEINASTCEIQEEILYKLRDFKIQGISDGLRFDDIDRFSIAKYFPDFKEMSVNEVLNAFIEEGNSIRNSNVLENSRELVSFDYSVTEVVYDKEEWGNYDNTMRLSYKEYSSLGFPESVKLTSIITPVKKSLEDKVGDEE